MKKQKQTQQSLFEVEEVAVKVVHVEHKRKVAAKLTEKVGGLNSVYKDFGEWLINNRGNK